MAGRGNYQNDVYPNGGGAGGFGVAVGGGSTVNYGGAGGYGGGGGGGIEYGGDGGFGGGGGAGGLEHFGSAGLGDLEPPLGVFLTSGRLRLAAGGAIFVMDGASLTINVTTEGSTSFSGNQAVQTGNGSAYGNDLFLGGNVKFKHRRRADPLARLAGGERVIRRTRMWQNAPVYQLDMVAVRVHAGGRGLAGP